MICGRHCSTAQVRRQASSLSSGLSRAWQHEELDLASQLLAEMEEIRNSKSLNLNVLSRSLTLDCVSEPIDLGSQNQVVAKSQMIC